MKIMMLVAILYFFTICEYALMMEIGIERSKGQMAAAAGESSSGVLPNVYKTNPELEKFFKLFNLLAIRGHIIFAHPAIVDHPEEVLKIPGIIDELPFNERMSNFASDMRLFTIQGENTARTERELTSEEKKSFIKIKYPNTTLLLLLDAIKNIDTQNEIQTDLEAIWAEENADELRLRQKYLFKFGFIVDCIYAYYMDEKQKVDFNKIYTATITNVGIVEQHPFYSILTENKCGSEVEIRIFVNLIISRNEEITSSIQYFFISYIKERFLNEMMAYEKKMTRKVEEEYVQLRKDPYFPEKLPKIFNLIALLDVMTEIIMGIIGLIKKPKGYAKYQMNFMRQILSKIKINILKGEKMFISSKYNSAANQIPDEKLRAKLGEIETGETIFTSIFKNDIKYQYENWYYRLKVKMQKYLNEKYFGVSNPKNEEFLWMFCYKISDNILQKTLSHIGEGNTIMEEGKKNELLAAQLHLRIFCVGIRKMDGTKRIIMKRNISGKSIFHSLMFAELLEIVPGAMEKFNEIISSKEELLEKNKHHENKLFFEAVSEVRREICEK